VKTPNKTKPSGKALSANKAPAAKAASPKVPASKTAVSSSPVKVSSNQPTAAKKTAPVKSAPAAPAASKTAPAANPTRPAVAKVAKVAPLAKPDKPSSSKSMSAPTVEPVQSLVDASAAIPAAAPEQLVRATRPSARLAQITVPSLPPAVASTAAKSSFLPGTSVAPPAFAFVPVKKDPKLANNWKSKKTEDLSDAEVLAMPDDEYMNDTQLAFFRLKLSRLKQDILTSAGQTTEHLREDTVVVPDPADRATIEEEHALELRTRDRERKLLKKIEQSIHRIDAGDYGFCDETGEAIGVGRLLARPTATLSLEAQQRRELKQKMFGD
jgi:DnaK suppressor protein